MVHFAVRQQTVATPVTCSGVGVHTGEEMRVRLSPAPPSTGVVFVRTDLEGPDNRVRARADAVVGTRLCTELANAAGVMVSTTEHLMSALAGRGVDNIVVELDGPELPILDGSAASFLRLLDQAGVRTQAADRLYIEILQTVEVLEAGKRGALSPADAYELDVEIRYDSEIIGRQSIALTLDETSFRRELASARTFGFLHEVEQLRALGLAKGGDLDNAIVIDEGGIMNPGGLRMEREFVRHKAMDAVGDLYLLGAPILGRLTTVCGGHALNNRLARALLARPEAYRMRTLTREMAEAV